MTADTLTADGSPVSLAPPAGGDGNLPAGPYAEKSYAALPGHDEVVVVSVGNNMAVLDGYTLAGAKLFETVLANDYGAMGKSVVAPSVFAVGANGEFGGEWDLKSNFYHDNYHTYYASDYYSLFDASGVRLATSSLDPNYQILPGSAAASTTPTGFHVEWVTQYPTSQTAGPPTYAEASGDFSAQGANQGVTRTDGQATAAPYAAAAVGSHTLAIRDNQVMFDSASVGTLPGEPAHAVTGVAAVGLASGTTAAVGWVDSGTDYVSLLNTQSDTFGPVIGLDWGGASDLHVVGLPDGGFAVSWMNGGAYKGELFDSAGNGGGVMSLAGDVAGIDSHGGLYTVAPNSSGQYVVQTYAINGSGGSSTGGTGGGGGSGSGGGSGQTYTSDNNGDTWVGTPGDDTFHLGRGGDTVTGNGGNDTYMFAEVPWAVGHITDFNAGDVLDLTAMIASSGGSASGSLADAHLALVNRNGSTEVDTNYTSATQTWKVVLIDGVTPDQLTYRNGVLTEGGSSSGGGGTAGQTYTSDNNGDHWVGTPGDDTFHLGRGGDTVTGGAGADTFAYAETPWAGGVITDFTGAEGDRIDVSGLLAKSGYTGSDPFADGYLKYTTDSAGDAQLWSDVHQPGNDGWWLVTTLDGVSTSSLHYAGGLIT